MRCNRKTAGFAVTPRRKVVDCLSITEIWQLRRREKAKAEITGGFRIFTLFRLLPSLDEG